MQKNQTLLRSQIIITMHEFLLQSFEVGRCRRLWAATDNNPISIPKLVALNIQHHIDYTTCNYGPNMIQRVYCSKQELYRAQHSARNDYSILYF